MPCWEDHQLLVVWPGCVRLLTRGLSGMPHGLMRAVQPGPRCSVLAAHGIPWDPPPSSHRHTAARYPQALLLPAAKYDEDAALMQQLRCAAQLA